uniref:KH homology domain-containing protein 1-like isoform X2 n=1 Tax=Panthera onca TaxID=9690 RepID=UPI0029558C39|nr:KH homology domain-containing protein 1-like isoform X2 [Panthera onca]
MLTVFQRCFDVLIVVKDILGCGVLIFIIGWPFYQYLAMLLSTTMASQLRIRRNRGSWTVSEPISSDCMASSRLVITAVEREALE